MSYFAQGLWLVHPGHITQTWWAQSDVAKCDWGARFQISRKVRGDVKVEALP